MAGTIAGWNKPRPKCPRTQVLQPNSSKRRTRTTGVVRVLETAVELLLLDEGNGRRGLFEFHFALEAEFTAQIIDAALEVAADLLFHLGRQPLLHGVVYATGIVGKRRLFVIAPNLDFAAEYVAFEFGHSLCQVDRSLHADGSVILNFVRQNLL